MLLVLLQAVQLAVRQWFSSSAVLRGTYSTEENKEESQVWRWMYMCPWARAEVDVDDSPFLFRLE